MSGRSSWCFSSDHGGCRFAACACACHTGAVARVEAVAPRPVLAGPQGELSFADSIDGSTDDVATVAFSLRGQRYEVDLSREHREQLRAALAPFVAAARPARE
ncbi:Lsr2 dimerization domain-containing protein [Quadrisphaera oryzae]|uniref:Lsr2 dimerization domain-containing protein n=1 Tax=Quadrisphaera TaxID=317661 RepID=UPI001C97EA74